DFAEVYILNADQQLAVGISKVILKAVTMQSSTEDVHRHVPEIGLRNCGIQLVGHAGIVDLQAGINSLNSQRCTPDSAGCAVGFQFNVDVRADTGKSCLHVESSQVVQGQRKSAG